jgi:beta-glucosidase
MDFWEITGAQHLKMVRQQKNMKILKGLSWFYQLNVKGVEDVRSLQKIAVEETRLGIPMILVLM